MNHFPEKNAQINLHAARRHGKLAKVDLVDQTSIGNGDRGVELALLRSVDRNRLSREGWQGAVPAAMHDD